MNLKGWKKNAIRIILSALIIYILFSLGIGTFNLIQADDVSRITIVFYQFAAILFILIAYSENNG